MRQNSKSWILWLSLFTTIGFFIVNSTGFVDTMTGSASGCGKSWPLCNGSLLPALDIHSIIEYGHRLLVFLVSVMLVSLSVFAWRKYGSNRRVRVSIFLALLGLVMESTLGALSVFLVNQPAILALHMGIALLTFSALMNLTVFINQMDGTGNVPQVQVSHKFKKFMWGTIIYTYLAIYFGGYVAKTGAGVDFKGLLVPTERETIVSGALLIDIVHRAIALGLVVLIVTIFVMARKMKAERRDLYASSILNVVLVLLQAVSGILLVYTNLSFGAVLMHVSVITLLFGTMTVMGVQSLRISEKSQVKGEKITIKKILQRV